MTHPAAVDMPALLESVNLLDKSERPIIVGVGGFTSGVGKTTLLCDLLRSFPGWEAIKTTRGHYRSCGKDPHTCCVSDLLADEPVVRTGRELTYVLGKDTGHYWEAGATNVHWVIATDNQVEAGISTALGRVKAKGVFVEGNSFTKYIDPDYFVMVARPNVVTIKATAKEVLERVSSVYLSGELTLAGEELLEALLSNPDLSVRAGSLQVFSQCEIGKLVSTIRELVSSAEAPDQTSAGADSKILVAP